MRSVPLAWFVTLAACGGGELDGPRRGAVSDDAGPAPASTCAAGLRAGVGAVCFRTGIQACAPELEGDDGLCRPSMSRCRGGTVPDAALGCVPVGIDGCDPRFVSQDGMCRPSSSACMPGSIPAFETGCVPVGVTGCAAPFVGADGVCHLDDAACPSGAVPLPTEGCLAMGASCADPPAEAGDVHVDASQVGPGDGAVESPFSTIAAAIAVVPDGKRIVIHAGDYGESLLVTRPITMVGRCPAEVRIHPVSKQDAVITVSALGALQLSGVTLSGPAMGVLVDGGSLDAHDVAIVGATARGGYVKGAGARARFEHVAITDTLSDADGTLGGGLHLADGAQGEVESSAFVRNRSFGLWVDGVGTTVVMRRSSISKTSPSVKGAGHGVLVDGATATLEDVVIASSTTCGVTAQAGALLDASRIVVDATRPTATGQAGSGVCVLGAASATLRASVVTGCRYAGIDVGGSGTTVRVTSALIDGTTPDAGGTGGIGLFAASSATVASDHALYRGNATGIAVSGAALSSTADLVEGSGTAAAKHGSGIFLLDGATGTVSRTAVTDTRGGGVLVQNGATASIDKCIVAGASPGADGRFGYGIDIYAAGSTRVTSTAVLDASVGGVEIVATKTETLLEHVLVAGTRTGVDGKDGQGVRVVESPTKILGCALVANRTAGLFVLGSGGVVMRSSLVEGTLANDAMGDYGAGVYALTGASVAIDGCAISGNHVANILAFNASVDVSESLVSGALPGGFTDSFDRRQQGIGDGIVAIESATCNIFTVRVEASTRAGILFDDADGLVEGTDSVGNAFGIVRQGAFQPDIGDDVRFADNTKRDVVPSGDLPVPNKPLPVPKP